MATLLHGPISQPGSIRELTRLPVRFRSLSVITALRARARLILRMLLFWKRETVIPAKSNSREFRLPLRTAPSPARLSAAAVSGRPASTVSRMRGTGMATPYRRQAGGQPHGHLPHRAEGLRRRGLRQRGQSLQSDAEVSVFRKPGSSWAVHEKSPVSSSKGRGIFCRPSPHRQHADLPAVFVPGLHRLRSEGHGKAPLHEGIRVHFDPGALLSG